MKFAMNGALTIGTLDGANIEIREAVGADNIFIFGLTAQEIERDGRCGQRIIRSIITKPIRACGACSMNWPRTASVPNEPGLFRWIRDVLLNRDRYFLLADFASYIDTQAEISASSFSRAVWTQKAILNVARIGTLLQRSHHPRIRPRHLARRTHLRPVVAQQDLSDLRHRRLMPR